MREIVGFIDHEPIAFWLLMLSIGTIMGILLGMVVK